MYLLPGQPCDFVEANSLHSLPGSNVSFVLMKKHFILWSYTSRRDCGIKKKGPARVRTGVTGNFQIRSFQKPVS